MFDSDLIYGLVRMPWWGYALVVYGGIQIMFLGITLFLHREQSHGSLELHPILRHFFRFYLWFCSGTVTKEWVAVHRRHHAYSDQAGDPHSPVVFGLKKVVLEGYELYVEGARNPEILTNYGKGTPDDWIERNLYSRFPKLGIVLFCVTHVVLFGIFSIIMVALQLVSQPFFAAGIINGVGHHFGYRSYEMASTATNIIPWGLFIAGEELHNNHHAFPWSARFSLQKWEFDMGWLFITVFKFVGLCKVKRVAPRPHFAKKAEVDTDTIQALFTNRMHVLRDYGRRVVKPVAREVARRERDSSEIGDDVVGVEAADSSSGHAVRPISHRSLKDLDDSPPGTAGDSGFPRAPHAAVERRESCACGSAAARSGVRRRRPPAFVRFAILRIACRRM